MLRRIEWTVALLASLIVVGLHFVFFQHAGALWRDEVGTINLAARPDMRALWQHLFFDSFPAFFVLVVRGWMRLGLGNDTGYRFLGFLVGLSGLGSLWFNARRLKIAFPFFSLLLIGFSPTILIWGDSMRAWGWGIFWIVLTFGLVWQVVESPSPGRVFAAVATALGSVHSTYYNWVMLLAICTAGAMVALRNRQWKRSALVMSVGLVAGISVVPYLLGIRRVGDHYLITQLPYSFAKFAGKVADAVSSAGPASGYIWGLALVGALGLAIFCQFRPGKLNATPAQKDLLLFAMATLFTGTTGYFLFLKNLKFGTQVWYYSALMAVTAVSFDAIFSVLGNWENGRKWRLVFVVVSIGLLTPPVLNAVAMRMTNTDLIIARLGESSGKKDLIVVNPWYCGINFDYYYSGATPWTTLPAVADHSYHHYEPVMQMMTNSDQWAVVQSVLDKIAQTLKTGHRVWLVGDLTYPPPNDKPAALPPAPNAPSGWASAPYQKLWSAEAGYFVNQHATNYQSFIVAPERGTVNPAEYLPFAVVRGWKE